MELSWAVIASFFVAQVNVMQNISFETVAVFQALGDF